MIKSHRRSIAGLTLVEIMVAMVILTVGLMAFLGALGNIAKALHMSRNRTIANNLAQERIESLKNLSYHRILVTTHTATAAEPGLGSFTYDDGYYPSEAVVVGGKEFIRRVFIEKVTESGAGALLSNNWWETDTGLKRITVYVVWYEGSGWRMFTETNLRDNANRRTLDSGILGTVRSGGTPLTDATVLTLQNPLYRDTSDGSGDYGLTLPAGTYSVKASKKGYFSQSSQASVVSGGSQTVTFNLTEMGDGTISGTAYLNDHLVISQVVGSVPHPTTLFCQEYIEIFNPSTYTWTMAAGANSGLVGLEYQHESAGSPTALSLTYYTFTLNPGSYYLIANTTTVTAAGQSRSADALINGNPNFLRVEPGGMCTDANNGADAVAIIWDDTGDAIDVVGWQTDGDAPNAMEGDAMPEFVGLQRDEQYIRKSGPGGVAPGVGAAYDSNDNATDFFAQAPIVQGPRNSSDIEPVASGTPAEDAFVFVSDGLSASTRAAAGGAFSVVGVATGTWEVIVSSAGLFDAIPGVVVTDGATTNMGNVILGTQATGGFIVGRVVDGGNAGLDGIAISASGAGDTTDSGGFYRLAVEIGTYVVTANPNNQDSTYTAVETSGVVVNLGAQVVVDDMTLLEGGRIDAFVSTNGIDPLPGVPVIATDVADDEVGSSVSDFLGRIRFFNLAVGDYTLTPQLEVGESALPMTITDTVASGSTVFFGTFTVSNAFGTINGSAKFNGAPIGTGVLLVAVPTAEDTIGALPPTIDSNLRNGAVYYYAGSTNSSGDYALSVRGGTTYNVHAWYTTFQGETPTVNHKVGSAAVAAGGSATLPFSWP